MPPKPYPAYDDGQLGRRQFPFQAARFRGGFWHGSPGHGSTMREKTEHSFDAQAESFDSRAGLPPSARRIIAHAVFDLVQTKSNAVVDVGAGTGEIGAEFQRLETRYVGMDASSGMLEQFRARLSPDEGALELHLADARSAWPVADASASVVFGSRSLHLLDSRHVAAEAFRVLDPGGSVVVGRVTRASESPRRQLQRQMRRLLRARGIDGRAGESDELLDLLESRGAVRTAPEAVAEWTVRSCPRDQLLGWSGKPGLAGQSVPAATKRDVLRELEEWAKEKWGDIGEPLESTEQYSLSVARLPT